MMLSVAGVEDVMAAEHVHVATPQDPLEPLQQGAAANTKMG